MLRKDTFCFASGSISSLVAHCISLSSDWNWISLSDLFSTFEDEDFMIHIGIADDILKEETRRTLIAAINALGEPDREILIRRFYYGQKPKEIALVLDMSVIVRAERPPAIQFNACFFLKNIFYVL